MTERKLTLEWVIESTRCPDWPDERVERFARVTHFAHQNEAGVTPLELMRLAELAPERLPQGDVIWLLLQPGALSTAQLHAIAWDMCRRAMLFARAALRLERKELFDAATFEQVRAAGGNATAMLTSFERAYRTEARAWYTSPNQWILFRTSRVLGLAAGCLHSEDTVDVALKVYAASGVMYRLKEARGEKLAQFAFMLWLLEHPEIAG